MLVYSDPAIHLTYCLNIHPGESWADNFAAIKEKACAVRDRVAAGEPFGLGLRLAHQAASELRASPALRDSAREFFATENLYPFTINGFPYGLFHRGRVKEQVYAPDWRTVERLDYTNTLADLLAEWLPEGLDGSISTVPGSFKPWIRHQEDEELMAENLVQCARHLAAIHHQTGKEIHLGLEPEPGCYLETTAETVRFFEKVLQRVGSAHEAIVRRHIGVCFDTCHVAMQFEDLGESLAAYRRAGIRISKVQLSAALRAVSHGDAWRELEKFCEPVYLHQLHAALADGSMARWTDLPEALRELPFRGPGELRVHFHVPLFFRQQGSLQSTTISREFLTTLRDTGVTHWEIETYTFDVLPAELQAGSVVESIAREYAEIFDLLQLNRPAPAA